MLAQGQQKNAKDALQTYAETKLLAKSQEEGQSENNSAPFTRNRIVFSVKLSTIFSLCLVPDALLGSGTTNKDLLG